MASAISGTADEKAITIDGKTYPLDAVKLVSIRRLQGAQDSYGVFVRTHWWVRKLNSAPLGREQAEQLAQTIADAVSHYHQNEDGDKGKDEILLAGNSVTIAENTLSSGQRNFPLDNVSSVTVSGRPNEDFERITGLSFLLLFLCIVGSVALGYAIGLVLNNHDVVGYAIGGLFIIGACAVLSLFYFGLTRSPGVWSVTLQTPSGRKVIYKSEDRAQAESVVESIRRTKFT